MNSPITKFDVFLYFANRLNRGRRLELEAACETNAKVRQWFAELTPTDEELAREALPNVAADAAEHRRIGATTYQSVEREERAEVVREWSEWIRSAATVGKSSSTPPAEIVPSELLEGDGGTLLYREPAPLTLAAGHETFSVPPKDVPRIYPDYLSERLIVRQALDRVPSGVVKVFAVRKRGENEVERLPALRIELERTEPVEGAPYWSAGVPLKSLIGDFRPGDDFIYCVEAVPGS